MNGRILAASLGLLCTATTPAPPPLTPDGWGPLRIGMTRAEVEAAVGGPADPNAVGGFDPAECDEFHPARTPPGVYVMILDGRLGRISLSDDSPVRTEAGFGPGVRADAVRAALGTALRITPHEYEGPEGLYLTSWTRGRIEGEYVEDPDARGIRYEAGADGVVRTIHAGGPSIQYVEGCA